MKTWMVAIPVLVAFGSMDAGAKMKTPGVTFRVSVHTSRVAVPGVVMGAAEGEATRLFQDLGIRLEWSMNGSKADEAAPRTIVITFLAHAPEAFETPGKQKALAYAQPYSHDPALITVFGDRVLELLSTYDLGKAGKVLGYVLAHEIAHILEGSSHHSDSGVMMAEWRQQEFRQIVCSSLAFADEDRDLIRRGLQAEESRSSQ